MLLIKPIPRLTVWLLGYLLYFKIHTKFLKFCIYRGWAGSSFFIFLQLNWRAKNLSSTVFRKFSLTGSSLSQLSFTGKPLKEGISWSIKPFLLFICNNDSIPTTISCNGWEIIFIYYLLKLYATITLSHDSGCSWNKLSLLSFIS